MSKPRVFVSSTYFDLKHVRSSLEAFISNLGFDVTLSEKGKIAYSPDLPLDESCYKEAQASDVFVLLIGGRYGSEASPRTSKTPKDFFERYNSITKKEYVAARDKGVPIYILIEKTVYSEYETYLRNKENKGVIYAHVDSVNVFELVEDIVSQPKNNPIHQFEKHSDIENWLREQWAGLFKDLLQRMQGQEQMSSLQAQVAQLSEINTTLKRYLEAIVETIAPTQSKALIDKEEKRLDEARAERDLLANPLGRFILKSERNISLPDLKEALIKAKSVRNFFEILANTPGTSSGLRNFGSFGDDERASGPLMDDINDMRRSLELPEFGREILGKRTSKKVRNISLENKPNK
ncbi:MAG: DUF4062 domain-containing protein [Thiobacillus sp.]